MNLPPTKYGALPTAHVSPAPIGNPKWRVFKLRDATVSTTVEAHSWLEARELGAIKLKLDLVEVDAAQLTERT